MSGYFLRKVQGSGVRYELGAVWEHRGCAGISALTEDLWPVHVRLPSVRPDTPSCVGGPRAGSLHYSHFWVWVG